MFFVKKLIEVFLFPPGIIIILFLIIAFLGIRKKTVLAVALLSAVMLYLFSIEPVANVIIEPLQNAYQKPAFTAGKAGILSGINSVPITAYFLKHAVIAVLASGAYNKDTLDGDSFNRLYAGFLLQKRLGIPIILSGGCYADSNILTSAIMGKVLVKLGIRRNKIIIDDTSNDTYQNAIDVKNICNRRGFSRVILITSAYHMPRAALLFKELGFKDKNLILYPVDYKTETANKYNIYSLLPQMNYLIISAEAVHEYIGYVYYYIYGRI